MLIEVMQYFSADETNITLSQDYLCLVFLKSARVMGNRTMHLELLLKLNTNSDATVSTCDPLQAGSNSLFGKIIKTWVSFVPELVYLEALAPRACLVADSLSKPTNKSLLSQYLHPICCVCVCLCGCLQSNLIIDVTKVRYSFLTYGYQNLFKTHGDQHINLALFLFK